MRLFHLRHPPRSYLSCSSRSRRGVSNSPDSSPPSSSPLVASVLAGADERALPFPPFERTGGVTQQPSADSAVFVGCTVSLTTPLTIGRRCGYIVKRTRFAIGQICECHREAVRRVPTTSPRLGISANGEPTRIAVVNPHRLFDCVSDRIREINAANAPNR